MVTDVTRLMVIIFNVYKCLIIILYIETNVILYVNLYFNKKTNRGKILIRQIVYVTVIMVLGHVLRKY